MKDVELRVVFENGYAVVSTYVMGVLCYRFSRLLRDSDDDIAFGAIDRVSHSFVYYDTMSSFLGKSDELAPVIWCTGQHTLVIGDNSITVTTTHLDEKISYRILIGSHNYGMEVSNRTFLGAKHAFQMFLVDTLVTR